MDKRTKELVDFTRNKWGLENYNLHNYEFYRYINGFQETVYTLSMEWYPNIITDHEDEDTNPIGTASIIINVHNLQFESVIFVGGESFSTNGKIESNAICNWIEAETGLEYGKQFKTENANGEEIRFRACWNGVNVSPYGSIEVELDEAGKLILFSKYGTFPSKTDEVEIETPLEFDKIEHQLKLYEYPLKNEKRLLPIYIIEEIYVGRNKTYPLTFENRWSSKSVNEIIMWQTPNKKKFKRKILELFEEITVEEAFSRKPDPDLLPITEKEKQKCLFAVTDFLSAVYPKDSGKWRLKLLHREKGYIHAWLGLVGQEARLIGRKLKLFIDVKSFVVVNYMDNRDFLEEVGDIVIKEDIKIDPGTAFRKIKNKIETKPFYFYDNEEKRYVRCEMIDCDFAVNGVTGDVISLDDL